MHQQSTHMEHGVGSLTAHPWDQAYKISDRVGTSNSVFIKAFTHSLYVTFRFARMDNLNLAHAN